MVRQRAAVRPKHKAEVSKRKHVRAKHKAHRAVRRAKKPTTVMAKPKLQSAAVSFPLPKPAQSVSSGPKSLVSFLIVVGLVGAIACFAVALLPATYMRWRPAVIFASERHLDLTVAGLAFLTIATCMLVWSRAV
jgi:hypothetical protein